MSKKIFSDIQDIAFKKYLCDVEGVLQVPVLYC